MTLHSSSRALSRSAVAGAALTLMTLAGGAAAQAVPSATNGAALFASKSCAGCHNIATNTSKIRNGTVAANTKNAVYGFQGRGVGSGMAMYQPGQFFALTDSDYNDLAAYIAGQISAATAYSCVSTTVPTAAAPAATVACPAPTAPIASLSVTTQTFGTVTLGTTSATQTVTITNTGTAALTVSSATSSNAAFAVTNNCTSVAINATCTLTTAFTPSTAAAASATLSIVTNAGTQTVALSGTGTAAPAPVVALSSSTAQAFGNVNVNTTGTAKTITLTNSGNADLTGINITAPAGFTSSTTCAATLPAASSCNITTNFAPTTAGAASGNLSIATTNGGTHTVALSGTGTAPAITLSASSLSFTALAGGTSNLQHVTLTNSGTGPLTISAITLPAGFSAAANTCVATIAAAATCGLDVTFTGAGAAATGTAAPITITSDAATTAALSLTGNTLIATAPVLNWTGALASVAAPSVTVGTAVTTGTTTTQTITLNNVGQSATAQALTVNVTGANASDFLTSGTCLSLATVPTTTGSNSCTVVVSFAPTSAGAKTATLTVNSIDGVPPVSVALSGTAVAPAAAPAATSSGGGCTLGAADQPMDPLWMLMLGGAALVWRRRASRQAV
jgi:mono/diheme cytochrome c family protein